MCASTKRAMTFGCTVMKRFECSHTCSRSRRKSFERPQVPSSRFRRTIRVPPPPGGGEACDSRRVNAVCGRTFVNMTNAEARSIATLGRDEEKQKEREGQEDAARALTAVLVSSPLGSEQQPEHTTHKNNCRTSNTNSKHPPSLQPRTENKNERSKEQNEIEQKTKHRSGKNKDVEQNTTKTKRNMEKKKDKTGLHIGTRKNIGLRLGHTDRHIHPLAHLALHSHSDSSARLHAARQRGRAAQRRAACFPSPTAAWVGRDLRCRITSGLRPWSP